METKKIIEEARANRKKIELMILVFLLAVLAFGIGYLFGANQTQEPLEIIQEINL
jgi:flagellar basal body-associated protein FliL